MLTESLACSSESESLSMECALRPPRTVSKRFVLDICTRSDPQRAELERFVQEGFRRAHGAHVQSFLPVLLALRDPGGQISAVTGLRPAQCERLYLESYLDRPIEKAIGRALEQALDAPRAENSKRTVVRPAIAEIGNFAARDRIGAQQLMRMLPEYLLQQGYLWIAFTATCSVRRLLGEFGVQPLELCSARAERVPGVTNEWGNYYLSDPRVMAGFLPAGLELEAFKTANKADE